MSALTIEQVLLQAYQHIDKIDAHLLLQHILAVNPTFLLTHSDQTLTTAQTNRFLHCVLQRSTGIPIAYLIGQREFYDNVFKVSDAVLIPRPETELLVDLALNLIPADRACRILDLGTGSGAIAITIAKHRTLSQVTAVDLSADAISIADWNTKNLQVSNVRLVIGNWFSELSNEKFDLIVTNPPYVAESDPHLQQGDLRFEPKLALSAGHSGMNCINHIIQAAPQYLEKSGWLLLEHGYDQANKCKQLLKRGNFTKICSYPDLAGIMRVSGGQFSASS
ncbi:[protein release factor]-glutamine N5-methyltransferase [Nitrosomonas sp. PY1]|uniref:peptide chain release factor N(5)-glutamine methyltransferase n=1 Tax=Nitrosomonas sp. PY1 TaxID=1803906 RepID=UPI001FC7F135|nr:peptide chain release factor N(5)-glutamine methyltransferase [Nitrosomonas sp. PY1]GKS68528.1 [protein release factor]-glutamine N5-methyltransferase [Nitrosomonas sp. PY1]